MALLTKNRGHQAHRSNPEATGKHARRSSGLLGRRASALLLAGAIPVAAGAGAAYEMLGTHNASKPEAVGAKVLALASDAVDTYKHAIQNKVGSFKSSKNHKQVKGTFPAKGKGLVLVSETIKSARTMAGPDNLPIPDPRYITSLSESLVESDGSMVNTKITRGQDGRWLVSSSVVDSNGNVGPGSIKESSNATGQDDVLRATQIISDVAEMSVQPATQPSVKPSASGIS